MISETGRGHRRFAAFWDWAVRHESREERGLRRDLVSRASGRVLEIGFGVGANWKYLPEGVDYVGIEPDGYMMERARRHAEEAGRVMTLAAARAEHLPFPAESFDTVLVTLTLCSVTSQDEALREARRVLRPEGQLLFLEHVRPGGRVKGPLVDAITPLWRRAAAGCHPNRRTVDSIRRAGFDVMDVKEAAIRGLPQMLGAARRGVGKPAD